MAFNTDVLVVGAGPIGLINALCLKHMNPTLNIVVLEKYEEYKRKHTLNLDWKQLEAVMKASGNTEDPTLNALVAQLKRNPNIRTNKLQEIFSKLAVEKNVIIQTNYGITKEYLQSNIKLDFPKIKLLIGADGTHSVTSETYFGKENQIKYPFDYVLQLRFDIKGETHAKSMQAVRLLQHMSRLGLIANEYVGPLENGVTPVTTQLMISREDFMQLQSATSKDPLRLLPPEGINPIEWAEGQHERPKMPTQLQAFVTQYLVQKIKDLQEDNLALDAQSITISVNEAPATEARRVFDSFDTYHTLLVGDAALGLSYFKGLNAGLEATAKLLATIAPAISSGFKNQAQTTTLLQKYQNWMSKTFAPKKVKEVADYSTLRIRAPMLYAYSKSY